MVFPWFFSIVSTWSFLLENLTYVDTENLILLVQGLTHLPRCTRCNPGVQTRTACVAISLLAPYKGGVSHPWPGHHALPLPPAPSHPRLGRGISCLSLGVKKPLCYPCRETWLWVKKLKIYICVGACVYLWQNMTGKWLSFAGSLRWVYCLKIFFNCFETHCWQVLYSSYKVTSILCFFYRDQIWSRQCSLGKCHWVS